MACVFSNCSTSALSLSLESHGVTVGFCEEHAGNTRELYTGIAPGEMLDDYIQLQMLMMSDELFQKVMKHFTSEVSRRQKIKKGKSTWFNRKMIPMSLNNALRRYEQLCWFGDQKKIMSGLLSFEEFKDSINKGYMVKDPGPGPDHGEFSHRLQWQYIMRVVTNRFTVAKTDNWSYSPLELYCGMFRNGNVWGTMLEGQQLSLNLPGSPTWVNKEFRGEGTLAGTSFGHALGARYDRRQNMVESVKVSIQLAHPDLEVSTTEAQKDNRYKPNRINVHAVMEYLYKWKKAGCPLAKPAITPSGEDWKDTFVQRNVDVAWELWTADPDRFKSAGGPQYMRAELSDELGGGISDGLLLHKSEKVTDQPLEQRVTNSKTTLNAAFAYSKSTGASKV